MFKKMRKLIMMFLRKILNKFLKQVGYEVVKLDRFKELLVEEYNSTENFSFIQIGANDGVKFDDLHSFVTSHKCVGLVVEPLKFYFEKLKKNYFEYPNIIPVNCAVHSTKNKVVLYHIDPEKLDSLPEWAQGIGSLDLNHHKKINIQSDCIISEEVECVHLMDIVSKYKFDHLNLLQIDVEGYDGEIIKMIDFNIINPKIIKYEHQHLDNEERYQVLQLLKSNGYNVFIQGNDSIAINTRNNIFQQTH